jgi:hypothetical protein
MSIGYPDYARLERAGGFLLYGSSNSTPPYNTNLFEGYIGLWPFLTLALSLGVGTDTVQVVIGYYTDETFSTLVGFRLINRQSAQFSVTQYANLSEWVSVRYVTKSGNPAPFASFGVYASTDPATQFHLVSMDVPLFQFDSTIAAGGTVTQVPQHVQPGPAVLCIFTNAAVWNVQLLYFDFNSNAFLRTLDMDNTIVAKGGVFAVALADVPMQVAIHNSDASTETFRVSLMSTL